MGQLSLGPWAINQNLGQERAGPIVFFFLMYNLRGGRKELEKVKLHKVLSGGKCRKYSSLPFEEYHIWGLEGMIKR